MLWSLSWSCPRAASRQVKHTLSRRLLQQTALYSSLSSPSKPPIFPYLKDKSPIIKKFHKNPEVPFNILRDVLNIQMYGRADLDNVYDTWLSYISMNDLAFLRESLPVNEDQILFWRQSVKLSMSIPEIAAAMVRLCSDSQLSKEFDIPDDLPELLTASYIYHQKYANAKYVVNRCLVSKPLINWGPLINVGLAVDKADGIRLLASLYEKVENKQYYKQIMDQLTELELNETYIHSWNNILVSFGDFPRDSSRHMETVFSGMLQYNNLRSFQHCLKSISRHKIDETWLSQSTSKIFALYICKTVDQKSTLRSMLAMFGKQEFGYDFWGILHKKSQIKPEVLDTLSERYGVSPNSSRIVKSKAGKVLQENPKHFYNFTENSVDDQSLRYLLPETMVATIRTSNYLPAALEICKSLIRKSRTPEQRFKVCKIFITECTRKILEDRLYHHVKVFDRLESYLRESHMKDDDMENLFIYSDIQVLRFRSALKRLNNLLENPHSRISSDVIDSLVKVMLQKQNLLVKRGLFQSDDVGYNVLCLAFECQEHCSEIKPITWKRIFKYVLNTYSFEESSTFILKISDLLKSNNKSFVHSSNSEHPLRKVFSDQIVKDILDGGFIKMPDNRWSGYETLKELEKNGIYVPETVVRAKLIMLIKVFHRLSTEMKLKKYKSVIEDPAPSYDAATTMKHLNEIT